MSELRLSGCRSEPLGSYLKALGTLRLVGEQVDPGATGRWEGDTFVLSSTLDADELVGFFVDRYRPTPMVAPWNGRSGFRTDVDRPSEQVLRKFETVDEPRLEPLIKAIRAGRALYERARAAGWDQKKQKDLWIQACRATFPDDAVAWLDAVAVLTNDGPRFPTLLGGAGGVLGSMDLSSNLLTHLATVLRLPITKTVADRHDIILLARHSLLGEVSAPLILGPSGQFDPGSSGGVNSSPLGDAGSLVNPWDYVLLLEGALVFASGVARRLGADRGGQAAMPFAVESSLVGYASAAVGEKVRGEVWTPLWRRGVTSAEVCRLIGEGRSTWRGQQARTGLDFARAAANLGVDRGIEQFVRHVVVERLGQANLAVPVGRIDVRAKPEVPVLAQLDPWVSRIRWGKGHPGGVVSALHRLDRAQFGVALRGGPRSLQDVLVAAADLETAVARSPTLREHAQRPLQRLRAPGWLPLLDDDSSELRLAAVLASQRDPAPDKGPLSHFDKGASSMALILRAVRLGPNRALEWSGQPPRVAGLGLRPITEVLAAVLVRRAMDVAGRSAVEGDLGVGQVGVQPAFRFALRGPVADVADLVDATIDFDRLGRLLSGLLLLDWRYGRDELDTISWRVAAGSLRRPASPLWALLAPFFHGRQLHAEAAERLTLRPGAGWPRSLVAGHLQEVAAEALLRLRIARLDPAPASPQAVAASDDPLALGVRVAAGLMCPLSTAGASALLRRTVPGPIDTQPTTDQEAAHA